MGSVLLNDSTRRSFRDTVRRTFGLLVGRCFFAVFGPPE